LDGLISNGSLRSISQVGLWFGNEIRRCRSRFGTTFPATGPAPHGSVRCIIVVAASRFRSSSSSSSIPKWRRGGSCSNCSSLQLRDDSATVGRRRRRRRRRAVRHRFAAARTAPQGSLRHVSVNLLGNCITSTAVAVGSWYHRRTRRYRRDGFCHRRCNWFSTAGTAPQ
jgi:hypothetical protein